MNSLIKKLKSNRLTKSAMIYTISTFFNSGTTFIMLPILTRYLTTDEYGVISMFNATVSFLTPFVCMGITTAIQRKIVDTDKSIEVYAYNCLVVAAISSIVLSLVVLACKEYIVLYTGISSIYLVSLMLLVGATVLCDTTLIVLQMRSKVKTYAVFQNAGTVLNLVSSIIMVVFCGMGLTGRISGLTFSKIIFAIIGLFIIRKEIGIKPSISNVYIKDIIYNFGLPMIPTAVKTTVLTYTDRLFITNMQSLSETGVYSVANQFSLPILLLAQAFNLSYVPWLYNKLKQGTDKKKMVLFTYLYFIVILMIAIIWSFVAKNVIYFISGPGYENAGMYVLWLSLGYAVTGMYMMVVNYIYYYKKLKIYSVVTITVMLSNVVLNYLLINAFGTVGAAQATLIANIISFILTWCLVIKITDMPWFFRNHR